MLKRVESDGLNGVDGRPSAVVIGAGLGGLAAAMRAGAKGYRVTVVDRLDCVGGRASSITKGGHRFDLGPTIVTVPKVYEELWAACGRDFHQDVQLVKMDPFYELKFDDGTRFKMCDDVAAMRRQIAQMAPGDLAGYDRFLEDAHKRYDFAFEGLGMRPLDKVWDLLVNLPTFAAMRADRSVYGHAARLMKDERLRFAASFHPLFIGADPFRVTSMYVLFSHLEALYGIHYCMGGVGAMAKAMANVVRDQGGAVRMNTTVDKIEVSKNKARGVTLESGEFIPADLVISNADVGFTYNHLLRDQKKRIWTRGRLKRSRWSMGLCVWHFGTKNTRMKWPDVGHHTVLVGPDYRGEVRDIFDGGPLADKMSIYLHRPSATDPSSAPPGDDTFYALACVPHLDVGDTDWEHDLEAYKAKMLDRLEAELLPGLRDHITEELVLTPNDFETRYLSTHGCGFSLEPRILQSGWFRPYNRSQELDGLYLVGAGTHPGAGVPTVVISGNIVGDIIPDAHVRVETRIAAE
ncbi:MAG: phytoene desaturase family protein [Pseudomonadota bacterium]